MEVFNLDILKITKKAGQILDLLKSENLEIEEMGACLTSAYGILNAITIAEKTKEANTLATARLMAGFTGIKKEDIN